MSSCICGSGKDYKECCELLILGKKEAETPEELMRSRYTAYAKQNITYVLQTTHPDKVGELKKEELEEWAESTIWDRLEIHSADNSSGTIDFTAYYREGEATIPHHEIALFKKSDDKWYFYDSQFPKVETVVNSQPKVGRNEKCPCGSGKKYKKCCGKK